MVRFIPVCPFWKPQSSLGSYGIGLIASDWRNASEYGIYLIAFFSVDQVGGIVLQCLGWIFEYTNGNIFDVDASIVGML